MRTIFRAQQELQLSAAKNNTTNSLLFNEILCNGYEEGTRRGQEDIGGQLVLDDIIDTLLHLRGRWRTALKAMKKQSISPEIFLHHWSSAKYADFAGDRGRRRALLKVTVDSSGHTIDNVKDRQVRVSLVHFRDADVPCVRCDDEQVGPGPHQLVHPICQIPPDVIISLLRQESHVLITVDGEEEEAGVGGDVLARCEEGHGQLVDLSIVVDPADVGDASQDGRTHTHHSHHSAAQQTRLYLIRKEIICVCVDGAAAVAAWAAAS